MSDQPCIICGKPVIPYQRKDRVKKFCGDACNREFRRRKLSGNTLRSGVKPANAFVTGHTSWNKGKTGLHLSPATEIKPGTRPVNHEPVGTVTIRTTKRDGKQRAWIKVAEPKHWRPRAVVVWELQNGPVPAGHVVHHKNENTLDDTLENLELQSRTDHIETHRDALLASQGKKRRR